MRQITLAAVFLAAIACSSQPPLAPPTWTSEELQAGVEAWNETLAKAEAGDAGTQFVVAIVYRIGSGVQQDDVKAAYWAHRSAEQGYGAAQMFLGLMRENGWGVTQDFAEAHSWYNLASVSFDQNDHRQAAASARDGLAKQMSPQQIAEAQRLAREWKPQSERPTPQSNPDQIQ